jgi:uncharacterized paraquat-inducible protein A
MRKSDLIFLAVGIIIIIFFSMAPPETTVHVPNDKTHAQVRATAEEEGKKEAEKQCKKCHNQENMPLSENHPPKYRCLFCHKTSKP